MYFGGRFFSERHFGGRYFAVSGALTITTPSEISSPENQAAVVTLAASGGTGPYTWAKTGQGADQARFSVTSAGALAFIVAPDFEVPTDADTNNTYVVEVRVTDSASATATKTIAVTVTNVADGLAPQISSEGPIRFIAGTAGSLQLEATGETPINWSVVSGALPSGVALSAAGVLSKTANAPVGSAAVTIRASNGNGTNDKAFTVATEYPEAFLSAAAANVKWRTRFYAWVEKDRSEELLLVLDTKRRLGEGEEVVDNPSVSQSLLSGVANPALAVSTPYVQGRYIVMKLSSGEYSGRYDLRVQYNTSLGQVVVDRLEVLIVLASPVA
jgi:hypothetical protein